jgi:hypothetical protein
MSSKQNRSQEFKRAIDLGQVELASPTDLAKIWRIATGDEKAISLFGLVASVDRDILSVPDGNLADLEERVEAIEGGSLPPVAGEYVTEAAMIADQGNQLAQYIYFDGTKYWEYLGTTNGTIVDYRAWSGGDIVQPNGLTQIGTFVQTGNDIDVNPDWIWRFNQVLYQKTTITPFTISPAAVGFTRIDLIYGNTSTQVLLISGTEVEDPTPAVPPSVPANSVGFFLVFVDDSGITAFQEFALSSFVRFDVNNQNLSAVQRQNARTNIQALSRDIENEIRPTTLIIRSPTTQQTRVILQLQNSAGTNVVFFRNAYAEFVPRVQLNSRSQFSNNAVRRDELPFNYPETVVTTGIINDLELANEGVKLLILTLADELTGVVPMTTTLGRELKIEGRNAGGVIIRHESGSSTEANRFSLPGATDLTINQNEIYTFIYTNGRWRLLDADKYPEAVERENNTVLFDKNYIIGNAAARTGNILFDFTGAKLGAWTEMRHADASAFTFPAEAKLMFDSADISTTDDNFFLFVLTKKSSTEIVKVFHAIEGGV